jgi:hypothetical protein
MMTLNSSLKMSNLNGIVDNYLAYLLARTSHLISNEFHAVVESNGLSLLEWRVMASLFGKKALSVGNLAEIILAKQPTVSKLVGRMEKSGWVKRYDSPHDKRQSRVFDDFRPTQSQTLARTSLVPRRADQSPPSSTANPDFSRFRPPDLNKIKHLQLMS